MILECGFKKQEYEVFIARDESEAIEILKTKIPDIILLDIMMSKVDWYQTLKIMKENKNLTEVKVVF